MFADNSIKSVFKYFEEKLSNQFSKREIKLFAEISLEVKFGLGKSDVILNSRKFSESELLELRSIVKRIKGNEPIQYILNNAHFYGLEFYIKEGVLIPRPETEELVDLILKESPKGTVLDIGTGSGIIAITLKSMAPALRVKAVDVSESALSIAKKNAELNRVEVEFEKMDVLTNDFINDSFDIIVSNPPYVLESDKAKMSESVLDFEPGLALFVPDNDPLRFYKRITTLAVKHLAKDGRLYFEIYEDFGLEVKELLMKAGFSKVEIVKDLQGKDRIVKGLN
jgi:release factor glutamine methyltransferase